MPAYRCYGLTIESDLDLPELDAGITDPPTRADVAIVEGEVGPRPPQPRSCRGACGNSGT